MPQTPNQRRKKAPDDRPARPHRSEWELAVDDFIANRQAQNVRPSTVQLYRWVLLGQRLNAFRADHRVDAPKAMTVAKLEALRRELLAPEIGLSDQTVVSMSRVLRTFLGWAAGDGAWEVDPAVAKVPLPKADEAVKEVFLQGEEDRLIKACVTPRDQFIVRFLLHSGLRLGELVRLNLDDFEPDYSRVRVSMSKTRRPRPVPLDSPVYRLSRDVRQYVTRVRPRDTRQTALLLTAKKYDGDYRPLDAHSVQTMLRRAGRAAGIDANPHKFRHTFATRMAKHVDLLALQRVLGHKSASMTSRYYNPDDDELVEWWRGGDKPKRGG